MLVRLNWLGPFDAPGNHPSSGSSSIISQDRQFSYDFRTIFVDSLPRIGYGYEMPWQKMDILFCSQISSRPEPSWLSRVLSLGSRIFSGEVRIPSPLPAINWHCVREAGIRIAQFPKEFAYPVGPARWHALCQVYRRSLEGLSGGRGDGGCVDRRKN